MEKETKAQNEETKSDTELFKERSKNFFVDTFTLDNVNYGQSIAEIKSGVTFKGFNIWILICSILICSLGLNMDSTAVVIGAMLISPLMGPIVGIGLGVGIFDKKLIYKALKNLGIATLISIVTAYLFFKFTPTQEVHELLARTKPTLLDLFVAFFGGIAGILAASRCLNTNAIPGVAIATALMPPLCTAGFGLAIGNWDYFFGAFYLFIMNCIMISLAALLVVLYLRYPKFSFVNEQNKKRARAGIILVVLIISIPSILFYYNLLQSNGYEKKVENFVVNEIASIPGIYLNSKSIGDQGGNQVVTVNLSGNYLEKDSIDNIQNRMLKYGLEGHLQVIQSQPLGFKEQRLASLKTDIISELYKNSSQSLETKDDEISMLKNEIQKMTNSNTSTQQLIKLAKSQYDIDKMAVDIILYSDGQNQDTIPTVLVDWKNTLRPKEKAKQTSKLREMVEIQLNTKELKIIELD